MTYPDTATDDPSLIEAIVGVTRHPTRHIIRGDHTTGQAHILHPHDCRARFGDLRDCPWSRALDRDDAWLPDDKPHHVRLRGGRLIADMAPIPTDPREDTP